MSRSRLFVPLLLVWGCVHPIGGPLEDARDSRTPPAGFEMTYHEQGGPLGSREVRITSEGEMVVRRWRPGFVPAGDRPEDTLRNAEAPSDDERAVTQERRVSGADVLRLVDLLVEIEGWEEGEGDDLPEVPVEASLVRLNLRVGSASSEVLEWGRDLEANDRLLRVRTLLEEFIAATE